MVATVLAFSLVGFVFSMMAAPGYEATAELIVQDPRAASTFDVTEGRPSTQDSERYLADQVRILESSVVVGDVADRLGEDPEDVADSLEIVGDLTSNLIEIRYAAPTREEAAQGANGVVDAYVRVVSAQVRTNASLALAKIDALQASIDDTIASISAQIDRRIEEDDSLLQVEQQISTAIADLTRLRQERDALPFGSAGREDLEARVREIAADLEALRLTLELEVADPELDALIAERAENVRVRSQLDTRRNTIEVDLELASANLALVSPARLPDDPSGLPAWVILAGFVALGGVAAAAGSYALDLRGPNGGAPVPPTEDPSPVPVDVQASDVQGSDVQGSLVRNAGTVSFWSLFDRDPGANPEPVSIVPEPDPEPRPDPDSRPVVEVPPVPERLPTSESTSVSYLPDIGSSEASVEPDGRERDLGGEADQPETIAYSDAGASPERQDVSDRSMDDGAAGGSIDPNEAREDQLSNDGVLPAEEGSAGDAAASGETTHRDKEPGDSFRSEPVGPWQGRARPVEAGEGSDGPALPAWIADEPLGFESNGSPTGGEFGADGEAELAATPQEDLTVIFGIGPNVAALLNQHGVVRFSQLAVLSVDTLKGILQAGGPRFSSCNPESWPLQATLASSGRWLALKALTAVGDVSTGAGGDS